MRSMGTRARALLSTTRVVASDRGRTLQHILHRGRSLNRSATLARLDHATAPYHADADAPWRELLTPTIHDRAYVNQLAVTYGFEAPLEGAFAYTVGLHEVIALRQRCRAGLIAQDLLAMGVAPAKLACVPHAAIMPFVEIGDALGWMYMVERATLLHDEVRRSVVQRLPHAVRATSFLCATGTVASVRWQTLGAALDRFAPVMTHVVDAALEAFRYWVEWVEWTQHSFVAEN
jgi:heme oxygenase